jgi:D-amino-acid dehydrogenase
MSETVLVIGAGIVGIACGLELIDAGFEVTLLERDAPGAHASRWNAGVLATSSIVPFNNPGLPRRLPALLRGASPAFRLAPRAAPAAVVWGPRFVAAGLGRRHAETVAALDALIRLSIAEHRRLLADAGAAELLSDAGWLFLYPEAADLARAAALRAAFDRRGVVHAVLDRAGLAALEPDLAPLFERALHLPGSAFAADPALVTAAYLARFRALGGRVERGAAEALALDGPRPAARLADGRLLDADRILVAAGPWSAALLATAGRRLPMMAERGYVRRFPLREGARLRRPVYDVAGGLVLAPRPEGVQLSTGTELTLPGLPDLDLQREAATRRARTLLPLGPALPGFDAAADRPSLPDSRPAIGPLAGAPGVWLCCGHQHIGFSTSAGSARLLAALMRGAPPPIDPAPFAPARFGL